MKFVNVWLLSFVLALAGAFLLPPNRYQYLVVHHTASAKGSLAGVRRAHWARGWFDAGYHLILANGTQGVTAGTLQPSLRYRLGCHAVATRSPRHNILGLHLSVVGNYDKQPMSPAMRANLAHALTLLAERYHIPPNRILLHRDCSATACPGRFVDRTNLVNSLAVDAALVDERVAARQRSALGTTLTAPIPLLLFLWSSQWLLWFAWRRWRARRRRRLRPLRST